MSAFKLEFDTDNDAFVGIPGTVEVSRILDRVKIEVVYGRTEGAVLDVNGNTVGRWTCELPARPQYVEDLDELDGR